MIESAATAESRRPRPILSGRGPNLEMISKRLDKFPPSGRIESERAECFDWRWDTTTTDPTSVISNEARDVMFNPGFSVGTVAVRGDTPFREGYHHYFEIKMATDVYGTSMMIGVGTAKTDLKKFTHSFVCLLGYDEESWGLSYDGKLHHNGVSSRYTKGFSHGSVIGVHLDLWQGTLEYYHNRVPLGKAFTGLKNKALFPIVSSTAARSGMNLTYSSSFAPTLQLQTLLSLSRQTYWPENICIFECHDDLPPGLKLWIKNNFWWIVCQSKKDKDRAKTLQPEEIPKLSQGLRRKKISTDSESEPGLEKQLEFFDDIENDASSCNSNAGDAKANSSRQSNDTRSSSTKASTSAVNENKRLRLRLNSMPSE